MISRFMKDYDQVLSDMARDADFEVSNRITFDQAGSILCTLGFLPENINQQKPDYRLFEDLWEMLDGPQREGVSQEDFAYVL